MSKYFHEFVLDIGYKLFFDNLCSLKALCSFVPSVQNFLAWNLHSIIILGTLLIKFNFLLSLVQDCHSIWSCILLAVLKHPFFVLTVSFLKPFRTIPVLIIPFFVNASYITAKKILCFKNHCFILLLRLSIGIMFLFTYLSFIL